MCLKLCENFKLCFLYMNCYEYYLDFLLSVMKIVSGVNFINRNVLIHYLRPKTELFHVETDLISEV